jgi:hypothetical protein
MTAPDDRPIHPWVAAGAGGVRFGIAFGPRNDWPMLRDFVQAVRPGHQGYPAPSGRVHCPHTARPAWQRRYGRQA